MKRCSHFTPHSDLGVSVQMFVIVLAILNASILFVLNSNAIQEVSSVEMIDSDSLLISEAVQSGNAGASTIQASTGELIYNPADETSIFDLKTRLRRQLEAEVGGNQWCFHEYHYRFSGVQCEGAATWVSELRDTTPGCPAPAIGGDGPPCEVAIENYLNSLPHKLNCEHRFLCQVDYSALENPKYNHVPLHLTGHLPTIDVDS